MQKSICVRTQIAKTAHLQPSIFRLLFDSYPLPLLRRLTMGAAIEKNFFIFQSRLTRFKFLDISQGFRFFWFIQYKLSFRLDTSFARYLLVCDSRIRFWIYTRINFDLFQHCLFYALTLQLFISSACYKQTSMLMQSLFYACFGYFKAFWRVFVCFRCKFIVLG